VAKNKNPERGVKIQNGERMTLGTLLGEEVIFKPRFVLLADAKEIQAANRSPMQGSGSNQKTV
jgi:hypothetical protein